MMSKSDYQSLADHLYSQRYDTVSGGNKEAILAFDRAVTAVADACEDLNPKFDRERFMCFVKGGAR